MPEPDASVLLVDADDYTASLLSDALAQRGHRRVSRVADPLAVPEALAAAQPDAAVFNFQAAQPASLVVCTTIRLLSPRTAVVALASPGPAARAVRDWRERTASIDHVIEKPLSGERLFVVLEELLRSRSAQRTLAAKVERLSALVPEAALPAAESADPEAELFEAAVLFTDIRGSSQLIRELPPKTFFERLNRLLSDQSAAVRRHEGSLVKYTGDGVMAVFRGMGRSYLALRCGLALAEASRRAPMACGVGVAEGLVLGGLIGDVDRAGERRQYDVIGATAHLAARLCAQASAGQLIAPASMNAVSRIADPPPRPVGRLPVRGFGEAVECVSFEPRPSPVPEPPR